jgi:arylsulfatase A-like enzyme
MVPRRWGLLLILLTLSSLGVGCSKESADWKGTGAFLRLNPTPSTSPIEPPALVVLERWNDFVVGKQHVDWKLRGGLMKIKEYQGQEILRFDHSKGDLAIEVPLDFEVSRSCVVSALMLVRGEPMTLGAALFSGKKKVGMSQVTIDPDPNLRGAIIPIKIDGDATVRATKLVLKAPQGEHAFSIRSLVVKQGALGMGLGPAAFGGYDLLEINGDARRCTALPSGADLSVDFEVSTEADVLRFAYAQREDLRVGNQESTLRLDLEGGGKSSSHEFEFDRPRWYDAEVSLAEFAGEEVKATWTLGSSGSKAMCILGQPRMATADAETKTVLLITSDTHRSDHLGFLMEEGELKTDAIDRLASQGVVFLDAVSSVNNTTPSHVSLFTGLSPRDTGIVANAKRLSEAAPTLSEAFRDAGYMTMAAVSASPVNYKHCGLDQGFDRYSVPTAKGVRDGKETTEILLEWLENHGGEPVFMWLHVYDAHGPYSVPEELDRMYYDEDKDPFEVEGAGRDLALSPYWNKKIADPDYTEALYKSEITYLDGLLGKLLDLPRVGAGIVAFTSDHGEVLRYGPGDPFDHRGLSLNTLAVPLIFKAPSLQPGTQRTDPVLQIDVGRTLLNLAGLSEMPFPGRDLLATTVESGEPRFALQANGISASVLTDEWMFAINLRVPGTRNPEQHESYHSVELYDIVNDKYCRFNVWEANLEKTASLRRLVIRWLSRGKENDWEVEAQGSQSDIQKELADLGYVTVEDSTAAEWFDSDCECAWCQKFPE